MPSPVGPRPAAPIGRPAPAPARPPAPAVLAAPVVRPTAGATMGAALAEARALGAAGNPIAAAAKLRLIAEHPQASVKALTLVVETAVSLEKDLWFFQKGRRQALFDVAAPALERALAKSRAAADLGAVVAAADRTFDLTQDRAQGDRFDAVAREARRRQQAMATAVIEARVARLGSVEAARARLAEPGLSFEEVAATRQRMVAAIRTGAELHEVFAYIGEQGTWERGGWTSAFIAKAGEIPGGQVIKTLAQENVRRAEEQAERDWAEAEYRREQAEEAKRDRRAGSAAGLVWGGTNNAGVNLFN